jgi:hypothetical protein
LRIAIWLIAAAVSCPALSAWPGANPKMQPVASDFQLCPGVVVDPVRGEAYLMNPQRGIDAIELSSGRLIWSSSAAAKPLTLSDQRLVAQAETSGDAHSLRIVVLDTKQAGKVVLEASLPLPRDVSPSINLGLGARFTVDALARDGAVSIWWSFSQRIVSGMFRPGGTPERAQSGAASVDLTTGRAESLSAEQAMTLQRGDSAAGKPPPAPGPGVQQSPARRAGDFFIATELKAAGPGWRTILKRWSAKSGEPLPEIEVKPGFNVANASADGALVLMFEAAPAATERERYRWSVYSLATGKQVAALRMPLSATPFFIWRSLLIYESPPNGRRINQQWVEEPRALRAVDAASGSEVWNRALRETAYRGPFPARP